jgi:hypothetical protein
MFNNFRQTELLTGWVGTVYEIGGEGPISQAEQACNNDYTHIVYIVIYIMIAQF